MALKKKFFQVEIPSVDSSADLIAYTQEQLNNRTIKLDLSRQLRGKSIEAVFRVKLENDKLQAIPQKLTLLPFFIKRMMRKNISYIEDSFSVECEDAFLRIKPFLITRKEVSRKVRKALREKAKEWIQEYCKDKSQEFLFTDALNNRIQKSLSIFLKKIYPLALCEIRVLQFEKLK